MEECSGIAAELTVNVQNSGRDFEMLVGSGASLILLKPNLIAGETESVLYTVRGVTGKTYYR